MKSDPGSVQLYETIRALVDGAGLRFGRKYISLKDEFVSINYAQLTEIIRENAQRITAAIPSGRVGLISQQRRLTLPTAISLLTLMYAGRCAVLLPDYSSPEEAESLSREYHLVGLVTDKDDMTVTNIPVLPLGILSSEWPSALLEPVESEDECEILFTSGTTAKSKGVVITHSNLCHDIYGGCSIFPILRNQRYVACLPYYHGYCVACDIMAVIASGACLCTATENGLFRDLQLFQPTHINGVPEIAKAMLRSINLMGQYSVGGRLTGMLCGGAAMDLAVAKGMQEHGITLYNCYGLTEFSTAIAVNTPGSNNWRSVGHILPCCEVSIAEDGEVLVRGENMMKGYGPNGPWLDRKSWFHTGDYGSLDDAGMLYIYGRKDNAIILPNGEKICPEQYENILVQSGKIKEAVVWCTKPGNQICVCMVSESTEKEARLAVDDFNQGLPQGCRITKIIITDVPLKRNASGKILRRYYHGEAGFL